MSESPRDVQRWLHEELRAAWPVALGCLSLRRSPCIREHCARCESGKQHSSHVLYGRIGGRRFALYISEALVPEVEKALARGQRVQQLLLEAGVRWIKAVKAQQSVRRSRRRAERK